MNSIPKTTFNFIAPVWVKSGTPFSLSVKRHGDGVGFFTSEIGDETYRDIVAIFRVYPKGQNPQSKLRGKPMDLGDRWEFENVLSKPVSITE